MNQADIDLSKYRQDIQAHALETIRGQRNAKPFRITKKGWQSILLSCSDSLIIDGNIFLIKAKHLQADIYELYYEKKYQDEEKL